MQFTLKFPAYAIVESVSTDSKGVMTFTNPLAIVCTLTADKPSIVALPIFTQEAQAVEFRQAQKPLNSRWVKLPTHNHLVDFLTQAKGVATHVALDPTATTLTSDRLLAIKALLAGFENWQQGATPPKPSAEQ